MHIPETSLHGGVVHHIGAVERVDDDAVVGAAQTEQEMGREVDPGDLPALGPGGMDTEDAEGDRQAAAAVDDAHQVGVLHVVIGRGVAFVSVARENDRAQRRRPVARGDGARRGPPRLRGQAIQMSAVVVDPGVGSVEGGEDQGRVGEIDVAIVQRPDLAYLLQVIFRRHRSILRSAASYTN